MSESKLIGQVGIVTGAANGLGRATTARLAELGAKVLAVDIDAAGLAETAAASKKDTIVTLELDLLRPESAVRFVERAIDAFGRIDFFFNNAGIEGARKPMVDHTDEEWARVFDLNVSAAFRALRAVVPVMRGKGGRIVNVGSCIGIRGARNTAAYGASKAAITQLTRVLAAEEAVNGISVNCIIVGPIQTALHDRAEASFKPKNEREAARKGVESMIPLGRLGYPEEIAEVAAFMLSPGMPFLTGADIAVDGGMTAALFRS